MTFISIALSVVFALIFSAILVYGFSRRAAGPFDGMLFLFLVIFMFTWGLGSWMTPVGPVFGGVSWLSYLVIAIVVMLLIGAMLPPSRPRGRRAAERVAEGDEAARAVGITFGFFFWFILITLFVIAILRVINPGTNVV